MHYKIEGVAYRNKGSEIELIGIDRVFEDEDPCVARKKCFDAYMSYLDVFYMSIGKEYTTHEQAEKDLQDFFVKDKNIILDKYENDNFIDIKLILTKKEQKGFKDIKELDGELLIHSIGSRHQKNISKAMCLEGLLLEYKYYFVNCLLNEPETSNDSKGNKLYKTPIDFTKFEENDD